MFLENFYNYSINVRLMLKIWEICTQHQSFEFTFHFNRNNLRLIEIFFTFLYILFWKHHICLHKVSLANNLLNCLPGFSGYCYLIRNHEIFIDSALRYYLHPNVFTGFIIFIVDVFRGINSLCCSFSRIFLPLLTLFFDILGHQWN